MKARVHWEEWSRAFTSSSRGASHRVHEAVRAYKNFEVGLASSNPSTMGDPSSLLCGYNQSLKGG
jgi:hypothetical protein